MKRAPRSILPLMTAERIARFWARVDRRGPDDCWPFMGARGYGAFVAGTIRLTASRVAWCLANQAEMGAMLACHSCDNPCCCNPSHIWPGTHAENNKDTALKGRHHTLSRRYNRRTRMWQKVGAKGVIA